MANKVFKPEFDFKSRIKKLQRLLCGKADALALFASEGFDANAFYYSGDEVHPSLLFFTPNYCAIFSLHPQDFKGLFDDCFSLQNARAKLLELLKKNRAKTLGVDDFSPSAGSGLRLALNAKLKPACLGEFLGEMRVVKQAQEINCIKQACSVTRQALEELRGLNNSGKLAGRTENEVAGLLEERARSKGAALDAFTPMVLSGKRACLFHNSTSNALVKRAEGLLVDCGASFSHYCADFTRTFMVGNNESLRDALEVLVQAQSAAKRKARPGATGGQLDQAALEVISQSSFAKFSHKVAGHGIGHFVGLNVHDGGRFYSTKLRQGMAFTIEPGIYVPGKFGARLEDTIVLG